MTKSKAKKTGIIIGAIVGVIVIVLLIAFFSITGSATTVAYLNVEAGEVQVNFGNGWVPATDGMELSLKDGIKTGADGEASLVLYESAIVSLDPGTEISIEDLSAEGVKIKQDSGSTWNKFTGLSGLKGLEVETPDTVATVRGTEFGVGMDGVDVMEGNVKAKNKLTGKEFDVPAGKRAFLRNGTMTLEDLPPEVRERLLKKMEKNIERLKRVRDREMRKHPRLLSMAMKKMGVEDEAGLQERLDKLDSGRYDEDALMQKVPMNIKSVKKFTYLTKKIRRQQEIVDKLRGVSVQPEPLQNEAVMNQERVQAGMPPDPIK